MILMDGAMGTFLMSHGLKLGNCFEALNLTRPGLIAEIHRSYADAGAQVITTNSFGANRLRLPASLVKKLESINRAGVRIARNAAPRAKIFASIGPLGTRARKLDFGRKYKLFSEQAKALSKEQPDGFVIETMTDLEEAKAATMAVREIFDGTILTLMAPLKKSRSWGKDMFEYLATTLRSSGADVIGTNCGAGPKQSYEFLRELRRVDVGQLCARSATGLPGHVLSPQEFADSMNRFQKLKCAWIGGCCGTTPAHIRSISESIWSS